VTAALSPLPEQTAPAHDDQTNAKILVVGASGFVGTAIVRAARARHDMTPVACMRRPSPALDSIGVETRICDAADPVAMASALDGVTYVVNSVLGSPATMLAATRNICEAARRTGVRRMVHLSSMAVYGPANGTVDETADLRPVAEFDREVVRQSASIDVLRLADQDPVRRPPSLQEMSLPAFLDRPAEVGVRRVAHFGLD